MLVILPGHQFIDKLIAPLDDLVYLLNLFFLCFFVVGLLVLVILDSFDGVVEGTVGSALLYWGFCERRNSFQKDWVWNRVLVGDHHVLFFLMLLPD
jgi:hypothetical protein